MQKSIIGIKSKISQIDQIILSLHKNPNAPDHTNKVDLLKQLKEVMIEEICNIYNEINVDTLFDEQISNANKKFIAICFLRLWNADETIFEINDLQRNTIKLFDNVLADNLYQSKQLNIKPNDQTFEKTSKIKSFIKSQEERLNLIAVSKIDSIQDIDQFKKLYFSTLKANDLRLITQYFLPKDYLSLIESIFNKVRDYSASNPKDKIANFSKLCKAIDGILDSESYERTAYFLIIIDSTLKKIRDIVENDFNNSPLSKPADITILPINKKYPLSQCTREFTIGFNLSNLGEGHAFDVNVSLIELSVEAEIETERYIGPVGSESLIVEFKCKMITPVDEIIVSVEVNWHNYDKVSRTLNKDFILEGQRNDIDWDDLKYIEFYSTEAVDSEDELIGRREILNSLRTRIEGKRVSSSFIYGQRRVGKSSIVKTLQTTLEKIEPQEYIVFYSETGDYKVPNPNTTINQLAENICNKIKCFDSRISHIPIPNFRGALSPISGYLEQISKIIPECRIVIILDEFDKIPVELYRKGEIGDSFFDTIRAISNKGPYGFILVGGERMEYIMRDQSQEMNKFKSFRVDYFNKKTHMVDFRDLITKPIQQFFEVTEEAVNFLYKYTSGNPYFTKVICEEMIILMIDKRDNHITERDMEEAKNKAVENAGEQIFAHFWKDGIRDFIVNEDEVSINRRKLLISLTHLSHTGKMLTKANVIDQAVMISLPEAIAVSTLKEFVEREVLTESGDEIDFKVLFFKDWLIAGGIEKLKTTLIESDRLDQEVIANKLAIIRSEEINKLTKDWSAYRGLEITTDKVRAWLEQFGDNQKQRLMFKLIQHLHFYSDFELVGKMKELYNKIKKSFTESGSVRLIKGREFTRKDILVSYLEDSPAKSGAEYAKLFADENEIFYKNVVAPEKLDRYLENNKNIHSVIFIDDFIGSGNSSIDNLTQLFEQYPKMFENPDVSFHYGVVSGFQEAKHKIVTKMKRLKLNIIVHLCDLLDDSDKVFGDNSKIFSAPAERYRARAIAYFHGTNLVKNNPLGYGDCQSLIVFPKTIPNNSLPILWSDNKDWQPLFPRPL